MARASLAEQHDQQDRQADGVELQIEDGKQAFRHSRASFVRTLPAVLRAGRILHDGGISIA